MSSAFVREGDWQRLSDVTPTLHALLVYLTRDNGVRIHEKRTYYSPEHDKEVYELTDGLTYAKDDEGRWMVMLDL
ncbi:MAG: hypothetical protein K0S09_1396 [Sphingobacteriaceae bacterium]|jgi:hypothetical protein|nr:hypothetical protein [Sphingobacteriaceae bacterium]